MSKHETKQPMSENTIRTARSGKARRKPMRLHRVDMADAERLSSIDQ